MHACIQRKLEERLQFMDTSRSFGQVCKCNSCGMCTSVYSMNCRVLRSQPAHSHNTRRLTRPRVQHNHWAPSGSCMKLVQPIFSIFPALALSPSPPPPPCPPSHLATYTPNCECGPRRPVADQGLLRQHSVVSDAPRSSSTARTSLASLPHQGHLCQLATIPDTSAPSLLLCARLSLCAPISTGIPQRRFP